MKICERIIKVFVLYVRFISNSLKEESGNEMKVLKLNFLPNRITFLE